MLIHGRDVCVKSFCALFWEDYNLSVDCTKGQWIIMVHQWNAGVCNAACHKTNVSLMVLELKFSCKQSTNLKGHKLPPTFFSVTELDNFTHYHQFMIHSCNKFAYICIYWCSQPIRPRVNVNCFCVLTCLIIEKIYRLILKKKCKSLLEQTTKISSFLTNQ